MTRDSSPTDGVDRRQFVKTTAAVGAAGITGLAGCSGGGDTITFGQPALLSGDLQSIQPPVSASTDMAVEKINEAGGPLDQEIEVVRRDTGRNPETGRSVFEAFVEQDDAVVINGFTSSVAQPIWDFIQEQQVPIVSMYAGTAFLDCRGGDGGTPQDLSDDGWFWRTTGADSQHTAGAAIHAAENTEGSPVRMGVIHSKTAGSTEWAEAVKTGAEAREDVEFTELVPVDAGQSAYRSELDGFFDNDVDVMGVAMGVPSATTLIRNWADGGYGGNLMLENPLQNPDLASNVADVASNADGWIRLSVPAIAGPYGDTYIEEFQQFVSDSDEYDGVQRNNWSASAYDAITVSALAIQRAGEATHDAIQQNIGPVARPPGTEVSTFAEGKEALENGEQINYVGAQTPVDFNDFGDVFNRADVFELQDGEFARIGEVTAEQIAANIEKQRQSS